MKISIVTICFNSGPTIERTIKSVVDQDIDGLEYIIVDGGSTDGTMDVVGKYFGMGKVSAYVSEKDEGISDAFNKGIAMSTGDVVGIINSDDIYLPGALGKVYDVYASRGTDFILYGNMLRETPEGRVRIKPRPLPELWKYVDCPFDHPTVFVPKSIYARVKAFDKRYRLAMDYDFYLRAMKAKIEFFYLDEDIALFSTGGASSRSVRECHREVLRSQIENGLSAPVCRLTFGLKMLVNSLKSVRS